MGTRIPGIWPQSLFRRNYKGNNSANSGSTKGTRAEEWETGSEAWDGLSSLYLLKRVAEAATETIS